MSATTSGTRRRRRVPEPVHVRVLGHRVLAPVMRHADLGGHAPRAWVEAHVAAQRAGLSTWRVLDDDGREALLVTNSRQTATS